MLMGALDGPRITERVEELPHQLLDVLLVEFGGGIVYAVFFGRCGARELHKLKMLHLISVLFILFAFSPFFGD